MKNSNILFRAVKNFIQTREHKGSRANALKFSFCHKDAILSKQWDEVTKFKLRYVWITYLFRGFPGSGYQWPSRPWPSLIWFLLFRTNHCLSLKRVGSIISENGTFWSRKWGQCRMAITYFETSAAWTILCANTRSSTNITYFTFWLCYARWFGKGRDDTSLFTLCLGISWQGKS